jgi:hypothetical protein
LVRQLLPLFDAVSENCANRWRWHRSGQASMNPPVGLARTFLSKRSTMQCTFAWSVSCLF